MFRALWMVLSLKLNSSIRNQPFSCKFGQFDKKIRAKSEMMRATLSSNHQVYFKWILKCAQLWWKLFLILFSWFMETSMVYSSIIMIQMLSTMMFCALVIFQLDLVRKFGEKHEIHSFIHFVILNLKFSLTST